MENKRKRMPISDSTTQMILTQAIEQDIAFRGTRRRVKVLLWIWIIMLVAALACEVVFAVTDPQLAGSWKTALIKGGVFFLFYVVFALIMYGGVRIVALFPALGILFQLRELYLKKDILFGTAALGQLSWLTLAAVTLLQLVVVLFVLFSPTVRHYEETMKHLSRKTAEERDKK